MKSKRILALALCALVALATLASCGGKTEDTRETLQVIGVVIKNDLDSVFDEMYIYPADRDYNSEKREMGPDLIDNTGGVLKKGSYGATIEESDMYKVMIRDHRGGVYEFGQVGFRDGDYAVISYDDQLTLTIEHRGGGTETLTGQYVTPDDAPTQPYVPLQKKVSYEFSVVNGSEANVTYVSMREADNQTKGDVELRTSLLGPEQDFLATGRLFEDDKEKKFVIYIETDDGKYFVSTETFSPFEISKATIEKDGNGLDVAFEEKE